MTYYECTVYEHPLDVIVTFDKNVMFFVGLGWCNLGLCLSLFPSCLPALVVSAPLAFVSQSGWNVCLSVLGICFCRLSLVFFLLVPFILLPWVQA